MKSTIAVPSFMSASPVICIVSLGLAPTALSSATTATGSVAARIEPNAIARFQLQPYGNAYLTSSRGRTVEDRTAAAPRTRSRTVLIASVDRASGRVAHGDLWRLARYNGTTPILRGAPQKRGNNHREGPRPRGTAGDDDNAARARASVHGREAGGEGAEQHAGAREQQALREGLLEHVHVEPDRVAEEQRGQERVEQQVAVDVGPHVDRLLHRRVAVRVDVALAPEARDPLERHPDGYILVVKSGDPYAPRHH